MCNAYMPTVSVLYGQSKGGGGDILRFMFILIFIFFAMRTIFFSFPRPASGDCRVCLLWCMWLTSCCSYPFLDLGSQIVLYMVDGKYPLLKIESMRSATGVKREGVLHSSLLIISMVRLPNGLLKKQQRAFLCVLKPNSQEYVASGLYQIAPS